MALMTRKASVLSQIEDRKRLYIPSTDCQVMVMVMLAYRSPSFTYTISARRNSWVFFIPNLNCEFLSDVVVIRLVLKWIYHPSWMRMSWRIQMRHLVRVVDLLFLNTLPIPISIFSEYQGVFFMTLRLSYLQIELYIMNYLGFGSKAMS